jgi:hypothetical protein
MVQPLAGHELVGTRRATAPGSLIDLWFKATSAIVKYGFAIEYFDLEPPRTGIFDGLKISIDPDVDFEMQCFILLHLFGHSVQWTAPSLAANLAALKDTTDKAVFMQVLHDYEYQAARFGMQLMREIGVRDLDQWYSDFVGTDWRYVERYYQTDKIPPWHECVVRDQPLVEPLAIPPIEHKQVEVRYAF